MREQSRCSTEPPRTLDPIPTPRAFFDPTLLRRHQYLLVVESRDYPGLLLTITRALTKAGLEVLSSNVTTQGWLARDCFEVRDPSLSELSPGRLSHIRASIVLAVQQGANGFLRR
jgi:UTP:GlnB (protein PII) uridylyltransferase